MTPQVIEISPDIPFHEEHPAMCEFVRQQYGLDPDRIPVGSTITVDFAARTVEAVYITLDESGLPVGKPDLNEVVTERRVQRMESEPKRWPW